MLNKLNKLFRNNNIEDIFRLVLSRLIRPKIDNYDYIMTLFSGRSGIEIGGPSGDFKARGFIPIYNIVKLLDGCNYSTTTIWEGNIGNMTSYLRDGPPGVQYISEATDLSFSPDAKYDFVISSNCLEHVANPLKAINEWLRVIRNDGLLLLVLPNKDYCFDHKRFITSMNHLIDDYNKNIDEDDMTHLDEILKLHDLKMDKCAGSIDQFKARSLDNQHNRTLHHHVFNCALLNEIFHYFKLETLLTYEGNIGHVILGCKIM